MLLVDKPSRKLSSLGPSTSIRPTANRGGLCGECMCGQSAASCPGCPTCRGDSPRSSCRVTMWMACVMLHWPFALCTVTDLPSVIRICFANSADCHRNPKRQLAPNQFDTASTETIHPYCAHPCRPTSPSLSSSPAFAPYAAMGSATNARIGTANLRYPGCPRCPGTSTPSCISVFGSHAGRESQDTLEQVGRAEQSAGERVRLTTRIATHAGRL